MQCMASCHSCVCDRILVFIVRSLGCHTPCMSSLPGGNTDGTGDGGNVGVTEDPSDVVDLTLDDVNQTLANVSGINHATNLGCSQLLTYYISVVTCALLAVALRY